MQSYQNVSNSQHQSRLYCSNRSCKRFCKVIKMLAIHNFTSQVSLPFFAANAFAKLSKCQQFTTTLIQILRFPQLQTLLQSYQNVSNSQRTLEYSIEFTSCKRFCKVIKMLAIHNRPLYHSQCVFAANAFAKLSKCQQFTTQM